MSERSPSLRTNLVANYLGNGWVALISLAVVPGYLRWLGAEGLGLILFWGTLQGLCSLLDFGLAALVTREAARLRAGAGAAQDLRNLVRTAEVVCWVTALILPAVIALLAWPIATYWLNGSGLSPETLHRAILLMGAAIGARWPFTFYSGVLLGLERQVALNVLRVVLETMRGPGSLLLLALVYASPEVFFAWQIAAGVAASIASAILVSRLLPRTSGKASVSVAALRGRAGFALGMNGIAMTTVLLTQTDKLVLSKLLPLHKLGYYGLALSVSSGLVHAFSPIMQSFYPRLTHLVQRGNEAALATLYHRGCQIMSVVVLPLGLTIGFFSRDILLAWTRNPAAAAAAAPVLSVLVAGTAMNGVMNLPYALQLANGWTSLALRINSVAILLTVPLTVVLVSAFGAIGGATVWALLNAGYVFVTIPIMHQRLLRGQLREWYLRDVGLPLLAALAVVLPASLIARSSIPRLETVMLMSAIVVAATGASALAANEVSGWIARRLSSAPDKPHSDPIGPKND